MSADHRCCAVFAAKLTIDQEERRVLATKAARLDQLNRPITRIVARLKELETVIAVDKQNIVDHEAMHAAEVQVA